jgi:uncharacterized protein
MSFLPHHRQRERAELKARFIHGASILMLAPRRIGKTWLMDRIKEDLTEEGWLCIKIDVQGARSEDSFLRELCTEIEKTQALSARLKTQLLHRFKQATGNIKDGNLAAAVGHIDPREFLETLVESLNAEDKNTLILIDELALFIHERAEKDPEGAQSLLYHLRKLRLAFPKVRWFLTGSVGLDIIARRHKMAGALVDYDNYPIEPFSIEATRSYIDFLCDSGQISHPFTIDDAGLTFLVRELGWLSPYYLRQLALQMRPSGSIPHGLNYPLANNSDIERAFAQLLLPAQRTHFETWVEHIDKNFHDLDTERLHAILDIACDEADGEMETTFLTRLGLAGTALTKKEWRSLVGALQTDDFLKNSEGRWSFRSGLLRRYWKEYMRND